MKRTVQIGRCKSCNETYKVLVVFVKGRVAKPPSVSTEKQTETVQPKIETGAELPHPFETQAADNSLLDNSSPDYSGLAEALFGPTTKEQRSESSQSSQ
ncbi:hypothetical protein J2P12_00205 [Candidatus Bathyarchaeota archaeon]|nr:hypothetical protein [Candidatus Bathyarchaeota archaeon]